MSAHSTAQAAPVYNADGCVTNYEAGQDYFPVKLTPYADSHFTIDYFSTYKVVKNTVAPALGTYVLWQCGTPKVLLHLPLMFPNSPNEFIFPSLPFLL